MKPIIELLAECNQFIEENPREYGLELTVRDVKIIAEALEKQVAKKPDENTFEYKCSNCNTHVAYGDEYCWKCGQRQDWSEE